MKFLNKIFNKKKVEEDIAEEETYYPEEIEEDLICSQCNMIIHPEQKVKTFAGEKMHMKPCWFRLRRLAKNYM